jgi:hypothetical protein
MMTIMMISESPKLESFHLLFISSNVPYFPTHVCDLYLVHFAPEIVQIIRYSIRAENNVPITYNVN